MQLRHAAAVLALTASAASAQTNINLSAFGVLQDLLRKDLYAPFEATCNCKIVVDAGNSADRLAKLEARKDNPEIDLEVLSDLDALVADRKGLIEPRIVLT